MKVLILTVGIPGSGKSTSIKTLGLEKYAVSTDNLRILINGSYLEKDEEIISGITDKYLWADLIPEILKKRFQLGLFTIFDSTGLSNLNNIKNMAISYGYRIVYVVYDHLTLESCYENVKKRELNIIPRFVLEKFYDRLDKWIDKSSYDVFHTRNYLNYIDALKDACNWALPYLQDFNKYNNIYVCPDIHGMYDTFKTYLDEINFNQLEENNNLVIFLGDYVDRGEKSIEMVEWLLKNYDNPNCIFLLGNHDEQLFAWANGVHVINHAPKEYEELEKRIPNIKKLLRKIYSKFKTYVYFKFGTKKYFLNHAGIDSFILKSGFYSIPASFLTGVITQGYSDQEDVYASYIDVGNNWSSSDTTEDIIQIFGHRNVASFKLLDEIWINKRALCLECSVEYGNDLLTLVIRKNDSIEKISIINKTDVSEFLNNNLIKIKKFPKVGLMSLNFDRKVFEKKIWNKLTLKTRGLYKYIEDNKIAGRSYDKFFNLNEMDVSSLDYIKENWVFPVRCFIKYDGYLVLAFYNKVTDSLQLATKSVIDSDKCNDAKKLLTKEQLDYLLAKSKEHNVTFVLECLHKNDDEHPIPWVKNKLVLLDIIKNTDNLLEATFEDKFADAHKLFEVKKLKEIINNYEELVNFVEDYFYDPSLTEEGLVIEDMNQNKIKLKTLKFRVVKRLMLLKDKGIKPNPNDPDYKVINYFYGLKMDDYRKEITSELLKKGLE